jgi:short-subunit dehydrogenase
MNNISIANVTALITGANRGIGESIVRSFVKHGARRVYAAVRNVDSAAHLEKEFPGIVHVLELDLQNEESVQKAAACAGDVEIVVNNAGVLRQSSPLDSQAAKNLHFEFDVNVFGLLRIAQAFAPILKRNGGGAFVQINSVVSLRAFSNCSTYCASKAASYSLTQSLRVDLFGQGTHVLSVHPGPIATDMAVQAGILEIAVPAEVVSEAIVKALASGDMHLFPDPFAKELGAAYESFAREMIENLPGA